jgi:hypothetical protein
MTYNKYLEFIMDMKALHLIIAAIVASPTAVFAGYGQSGYSNQCFKEVYREEYTPGTINSPGYVRRWTETKEVPCGSGQGVVIDDFTHTQDIGVWQEPAPQPRTVHRDPRDDNSCIEGAIIGGILGGAGGAAASRGPDMAWAIPLGVVGGSMIGCQVDGG